MERLTNINAASSASSISSAIASPTASTSTLVTSVAVTSSISSSLVVSQSAVTSTSIISISPTTTVVVPPSSSSQSVVVVSSTSIIDPATTGGTAGPTVVTITSTQAPVTVTPSNTQAISSSSSHSATPSILGASGSDGQGGSGLSSSGKIAIAVIIPIVVIALLFFFGIFLWKKRRARKSAEEQRKDEMAEYGFNPNNDPTLVPVGAAYTDGGSEADDGYRGWGTTSSNPRKASTTMGSNSKGPNGMAYSDTTSQPGNHAYQGSPNNLASEHWSGDPLIGSHNEGIDGVGALGAAAAAGGATAAMSRNNRVSQGIQRGPSNASSSYSYNPAHSEASSDTPGATGNYHQEEVPYNIYNDVAPAHGPYGDGTYAAGGAEQPVIRDVQARRNTKIERVPTFPQTQGGISQNF